MQCVVLDRNKGLVAVTGENLLQCAGPSQAIASAMVIRLFWSALQDLCPDAPPLRTDIHVLSAAPLPGILDCIQCVTLAQARENGRLRVDPDAAPVAAPLAIEGRFYFEVEIHGNCRAYWPRSGIFDSTFLPTVLRYQDATRTPDESVAYQAYKQQLVERILHAPRHGVFSTRTVPWRWGK